MLPHTHAVRPPDAIKRLYLGCKIENSRFEVLRVVAGTKDFQRLLDLACPRERRACEHPHNALLPCGRLPVFTLDLDAQVAQLF